MADINQVISLGIGSPASVKFFITFGLGMIYTVTPGSRIYTPPAEGRTYTPPAESRVYTPPAESRTHTAEAE